MLLPASLSFPSRISSLYEARAARHLQTPPAMVTRPTKACSASEGVSVCLRVSDNPGLLSLILSAPCLLISSEQQSLLPRAVGEKESSKG